MNSTFRKLSASIAVLLLLALVGLGTPSSGLALGGLQNPGFEQGLTSWSTSAVDAAVVVGTETSAQCASYTNMGGVTVAPFKGTKSLRLGACRAINQSQPKGTNTASQTFTPVSSPLRVAFRLFSWEHRGSDQLLIELKKGNQAVGTLQSPVSLPMGGVPGGQRTCSGALPCSFTIDTGNSGNFVATNWTTMAIDVPQSAIGQSLTLSYSVIGGKDNGFPTWAYFDNVNTPPVARFDHQTVNVREGDRVQFTDTSFDPDGDAIVDWRWEINGEVLSDQNPVFIFADEGTYSACLTVTDSFGDTNRVCTGGTATDGTPISTLTLVNQPPRVNALNVETLAGQPVGLSGRTLESGWGDTLSANWQVNGQSPTATITNDMMPLLATAIINGQVTTSTTVPGTLTVSDQDGGTGSDPFQVRVVPNDPQRFEPNNSLGNVPVLTSDSSYLSWIQTVGDQDFFEVNLPDASHPLLPAGGEVLVTLKGPGGAGLNADYDLVILAQSPGGVGGFQSGDAGQTNINTFGFQSGGFQSGGFQSGGFHSGGFQSGSIRPGGFQSGGFQSGGFQSGSALYPLSQIGFNGLEGDDVGAADISLDELGLGNLQGSVTVAAYSGNHGTRPEAALARSAVPGTRFFIGVLGANAAFSGSEPYTLQVETSVPLDLAEVLGPEVCNRSPLVGPNSSNPPTTTAVDLNPGLPANAPTTLIVTQRERMIALYDNPATTTNEGLDRWNALLPKLQAVAQHPAVHADLISLPSVLYDNADRNPCDVDETNSLAAAIRGQIQARLGLNQSIQYVVIAGDDDVVPQRRVPDETIIGNESNYLADALVNPGSPLFASLLGGFILTDDYYVDDVPTPWNGRELYVPDRPIARLVETPEEIGAAADAFSASNGVLDYSTAASAKALVTGYDFFTDGATATAANLASKLSTSTLINPTWTADDLRCAMLGEATGCTSPSVIAANAHYTHYLALSANGFGTHNFADTLKSNEVAAAGGTAPTLQRHVVFTMGCHGGLNVPDRAAKPADPGQALDPSLDFAQAMARQRAVFVASTGYGLGDDVGLGGTELLLTVFGKELVKGDVFIGNALRDAKESYLLSLLSMTPYDEKSSIQLTMYGLPMYQVRVPEGAGSIAPLPAQAAPSSTFSLTVRDGASTTTTTHNIEQAATANGSYFTADGDAQTTAFRAIQPRLVIPLPPGNPAQGVLIKSGTYTDTPGFNPVISRPSQDWLLSDDEPQTCLDAYWPSVPATVNRVDPGGGQTLVVTPGQFRCTSGSPPVTGIQRNYQSMTVEILHSDPADTQPPIVNEVSMSPGTGGSLDVTVKANDPSGIARIILLKYSGGVVTPIELNLSQPFPATGTFTINVPSVQPADDIAGELVDGADNIAYFTAKGAIGYTFLGVDLTPDPQFVAPGSPASFQVSVPDFAQLDEPFYTIDFGDGLFGSGPVTGTTFNVTHTYPIGTQLPTTAKIRVMDADGRLGSDSVAVRLRCDPIGDSPTSGTDYVGCDVSSTATTITIAVRVVGTIESKSQYRVNILTATKNAQMKYDNGKATSPLGSLVVTRPDASELRFTFSRADVGLASGGQLQWYAEAQHGEPGNPTVGFPDRMPDNGYRTVVIP